MLERYKSKIKVSPATPGEIYHNDHQALINSQWDVTTQLYTVLEENPIESFKFEEVECHLLRGRDRSVGVKTGDDFREIVFKDIDKSVPLGNYYYFDDSYWLTTNKDTLNKISKDIIVRRCNNCLKWKDNDKVISYPVVAEYDVSKGQPGLDNDIITPTNTISLIVQANEATRKLRVNKRFIISDRAFKLTSMNNYLMSSAYGKSEILYLKVSLDEVSPYDNFDSGLAYNGDVEKELDVGKIEIPVHDGLCVEPLFDELRQNYEKEVEANLWIGGIKQDDDVLLTATGAPAWAWEIELIDHNKWNVKCKNPARIPLELTFECRGEVKSILVKLNAMF